MFCECVLMELLNIEEKYHMTLSAQTNTQIIISIIIIS